MLFFNKGNRLVKRTHFSEQLIRHQKLEEHSNLKRGQPTRLPASLRAKSWTMFLGDESVLKPPLWLVEKKGLDPFGMTRIPVNHPLEPMMSCFTLFSFVGSVFYWMGRIPQLNHSIKPQSCQLRLKVVIVVVVVVVVVVIVVVAVVVVWQQQW